MPEPEIAFALTFLETPTGFVFEQRNHTSRYQQGKVSVFGGHIESGEKPEEAALRELEEETTLTNTDLGKVALRLLGDLTYDSDVEHYRAVIFKTKVDKIVDGTVGNGTVVILAKDLRPDSCDFTYFTQRALETFKEAILL